MSVLPSSKYSRLSELLVSGGSDTGPKSEGVLAVTDATSFPDALTNPSTYGPALAGGAPTAASGLATPVGVALGVGVGEAAAVAGVIETVGVIVCCDGVADADVLGSVGAEAHPTSNADPSNRPALVQVGTRIPSARFRELTIGIMFSKRKRVIRVTTAFSSESNDRAFAIPRFKRFGAESRRTRSRREAGRSRALTEYPKEVDCSDLAWRPSEKRHPQRTSAFDQTQELLQH